MRGTLIVLEGTDGSGKSTQFRRLCRRLEGEGLPFCRLIFPRYDQPSSALIRMYLGGEFGGDPAAVNPYAASAFYAVDRYAALKQDWGDYHAGGGLVLADRYTSSNAVHQAAKLPPEEREEFLRWLEDFEHERLGLPRPDAVIYLDMPVQRSLELLRERRAQTGQAEDIHEADGDYLARCAQCARQAARVLDWRRVSCVDGGGALRGVEEIHEEIWALVAPMLNREE